MDQVVQVVGAILILTGFVAAQRGIVSPQNVVYLLVNLAGSLILAVVAWEARDWGFLLLETVWAVVSAWGLVQLVRRRTPAVT